MTTRTDTPLGEVRGPTRTRGCVINEDSGLLDIEEQPEEESQERGDVRRRRNSPATSMLRAESEDEGEQSLNLYPDEGPELSQQEFQTIHESPVQVHGEPESPVVDLRPRGETSANLTSTPKSSRQRVTRHPNTERKMIDWGLTVTKKWLIVGDSNLSRFPAFSVPDLQIESYPGANFRHAQALMKKATSHVAVEKLVLSFGLNSRGQKAKETAVKQLQAALKAAKDKFPHAQIWIPEINFSSRLCRDEQATLKLLNNHILKNMPYLPALDYNHFQTEVDNVHWTKETARAMLKHWYECLN